MSHSGGISRTIVNLYGKNKSLNIFLKLTNNTKSRNHKGNIHEFDYLKIVNYSSEDI